MSQTKTRQSHAPRPQHKNEDDKNDSKKNVKSNKKSSLTVFFAAYCLFLCPVWAALWAGNHADVERLAIPVVHHGSGGMFIPNLSWWLFFLFASYVTLRNFSGPLSLKRNHKTHAKHMEDLIKLAYFGTILGCSAGILTKIEHGIINTQTGLTFIPLCAFYVVFYTLLFELVKHEDITLEKHLAKNKIGIIVVCMACMTLGGAVMSIFTSAQHRGPEFFSSFLFLIMLAIGVHVITFWPNKPLVRGKHHVHVHHFYYGHLLSHMFPFATDLSMLTQAIFVSVMIHGLVIFGAEPIFYDLE